MRCLNSKFLIISMKNSDVIYCTYDRPRAVIGISRQLNAADAFNFFFYLVEFLQSILIENYK